jgi:LytR cell envelope-related transcriptional attenuator
VTGVADDEGYKPRHLARGHRSADRARVGGIATLVDAADDGDEATASLVPAARRPPWPASRRARALARRRVRTIGNGPAPGPGSERAAPASASTAAGLATAASSAKTRGAAAPSTPDPLVPPATPRHRGQAQDLLLRRRRLVLAGMAALVGGGVALAVTGVNQVRNSTAGRYVEPTAAPDDPGYQAYVVPTPTMAVVQHGADGELTGVAVLALGSSDQGGTVILVPASTQTRRARPVDTTANTTVPSEPPPTLADVYRDGGTSGVVAAVADLLAVALPESLEVGDARWASLVAPVAPVELQLTRSVGGWSAGDVSLEAEDVGPFLDARTEDESDVARVDRQADFWTAWLPLVREAGTDALPGEVDVGIGRFVRGLANGSPSIVPLPGDTTGDDGVAGAYVPHETRLADLVARAVPYPVSPSPDRRTRVRLLNGTTDRDLTGAAAAVLVRSGAEITVVGNAPSFDEAETRMLYGSQDQRDQAAWLAAGFGGGRVERDQAVTGDAADEDEIDVTVILGDDARDLIGR